ncbi:MAG: nucleotide exchange factor GrpE [Nitrospirota bacterium]
MDENKKKEQSENNKQEENKEQHPAVTETEQPNEIEQKENVEDLKKEIAELKDKYLRLYADFENYKRLSAKNKVELIKYSREELIRELLSVIDHLELALQHSANIENSSALAEGVQMTLKEIKTILEKFGLTVIEALGKPFDPVFHHAISQVESEETDENIVVSEFRKGYMLKDKVLRASLVGISKKPIQEIEIKEEA